MIGLFVYSLIIGGIAYYIIPEEGGLTRTALACFGALLAGVVFSIVAGTIGLGQLGIDFTALVSTPIAVTGVLAMTLRERHRQKQRELKKSPSDLRSR